AHLAPKSPVQVNKIASTCEIYSGTYNTQYCMENPKQAFVEYASSRTDKARGKWYTFKPEQNNLGGTYNPSWKSHPNLSLEGLVSSFMASQDARLSKFEANFKQQGETTNKIDIFLKAFNDRMMGSLPSDTVKNLKLDVGTIESDTAEDNGRDTIVEVEKETEEGLDCSKPIIEEDESRDIKRNDPDDKACGETKVVEEVKNESEESEDEEKDDPEYINTNPPSPPDPSISFITKKVRKLNLFLE
ncbi:hypothetical protein Tco_1543451, partial [Tanacetum coccineum]